MFFGNLISIQRGFRFLGVRRQDVLVRYRCPCAFKCWRFDFKRHLHSRLTVVAFSRSEDWGSFALTLLWLLEVDVTSVSNHDVRFWIRIIWTRTLCSRHSEPQTEAQSCTLSRAAPVLEGIKVFLEVRLAEI
jgi:hypothetical protein